MDEAGGSNATDSVDRIEQVRDQLRIYEAISRAFERWPEVSALAWEAGSTEEFETQLRALLDIDRTQASAIADCQFRRLPREQRARARATVADLNSELARLKNGRT